MDLNLFELLHFVIIVFAFSLSNFVFHFHFPVNQKAVNSCNDFYCEKTKENQAVQNESFLVAFNYFLMIEKLLNVLQRRSHENVKRNPE